MTRFGLALCLAGLLGCDRKASTPPALPTAVRSSAELTVQNRLIRDKATGELFTGQLRDLAPNGKPRAEVHFQDGRRHGRSVEWHTSGSKALEGVWKKGHPTGVVREWSRDGLLRKDTHYGKQGQVTHSETHPTQVLLGKAQSAMAERERLDQTVWAAEMAAQEHEQVVVRLWDDLREAKNPWQVVKGFTFQSLSVPQLDQGVTRSWGIIERQGDSDLRSWDWESWQAQVTDWEEAGWLLEESEWHQESFVPDKRTPESVFKVRLHVRIPQSAKRMIIKATLRVTWNQQKRPSQGVVESLQVWQRTGEPGFAVKEVKNLTLDDPNVAALRRQEGASVFPVPLVVEDLDGDQLPEIILGGSGLLYRNRGKFQFEKQPLLSGPHLRFRAGALGEFTGDGQLDWFAIAPDGWPVVFPGKVNEVGFVRAAGVESRAMQFTSPQCVATGDVDGDGDLDVFVGQYKTPYGGGQMPTPYYDANDGFPAALLLNDGTGRFVDATEEAGLATKRRRRTYSASWVDWDRDADLDLMVISDFAGIDLYENQGKGEFRDVTDQLGKCRHSFGMSHAVADFDGDGSLDIYMVGMGSTTARRLAGLGLGEKGFEHLEAAPDMGYGNRLLLGDGKGRFRQAPYNDRLARTGWSWGCSPWDFDNDGDRDLYVANGMLSARSAQDYCTTFWRHDIRDGGSTETLLMQEVYNRCMKGLGKEVSWNGYEHNALLLNEGEGMYLNVGYLLGVGFEFDSRSVVATDLDADGLTDLMVIQMDQLTDRHRTGRAEHYLHLVRNQMPEAGNWLVVQFLPAQNPVGTVVTLKSKGQTQVMPLVTGDSYNAQHPARIHFGLGQADSVAEVLIEQPGREPVRWNNPAINQVHLVKP